MKKELTIYTDGASRGNPGPGGWAAVLLTDDQVFELAGRIARATNNHMELMAVYEALVNKQVHAHRGIVTVLSDSAYVVNGLNSWVYGWEKNGWITSTKTKVENRELWQSLLKLLRVYGDRLAIQKVSGHSGELYNERCDELAVAAALGKNPKLFSGTLKKYEEFLEETGVTVKQAAPKKKKNDAPAYSYVSLVNGKVHVDKTWGSCEKRVKGAKGARYKKVFSRAEETALVQDYTLSSLL
ncbi:MAG TPA: RNase H family protein [Candidatus Paceibacterota bacterium]|nr:RNase H family protein [Candidatus Paceibacterota bacterium]